MKLYNLLFGARPKSIFNYIEEGNSYEVKNYIQSNGDLNAKEEDKDILHFAIDNCGNNFHEIINLL